MSSTVANRAGDAPNLYVFGVLAVRAERQRRWYRSSILEGPMSRSARALVVAALLVLSAPAFADDDPDETVPGKLISIKSSRYLKFHTPMGSPITLPVSGVPTG